MFHTFQNSIDKEFEKPPLYFNLASFCQQIHTLRGVTGRTELSKPKGSKKSKTIKSKPVIDDSDIEIITEPSNITTAKEIDPDKMMVDEEGAPAKENKEDPSSVPARAETKLIPYVDVPSIDTLSPHYKRVIQLLQKLQASKKAKLEEALLDALGKTGDAHKGFLNQASTAVLNQYLLHLSQATLDACAEVAQASTKVDNLFNQQREVQNLLQTRSFASSSK
ncbi:hypothetical protein BDQ17DRAFT_1413174 [Cyathus striatus]|nr:hypothetical protein BDQ17DRAFT_1413174 [Cyathus striatus]